MYWTGVSQGSNISPYCVQFVGSQRRTSDVCLLHCSSVHPAFHLEATLVQYLLMPLSLCVRLKSCIDQTINCQILSIHGPLKAFCIVATKALRVLEIIKAYSSNKGPGSIDSGED